MEFELSEAEQKVAKAVNRELWVTGVVALSIGALGLVAVGVLGWQCHHWLKTAEWTPLSWSDGFAWAGAGPLDLPNGRGVERIFQWLGTFPLWTLPIVVSFLLGWVALSGENDPERMRVRGKMARIAARNAKGAPSGTDKAL